MKFDKIISKCGCEFQADDSGFIPYDMAGIEGHVRGFLQPCQMHKQIYTKGMRICDRCKERLGVGGLCDECFKEMKDEVINENKASK